MRDLLAEFLSQFGQLGHAQVRELSQLLNTVDLEKGAYLVKEGDPCNSCYFVLKGCLRQFVIQDGTEKTIALYTENQTVNYYTSQGSLLPSESYLQCLEDSLLLVGNPEQDAELYAKFPALLDITRNMMESDLGKAQVSLAKRILSNAEQRYLHLLEERPDLLQRVPQHYIASYLGVTPESLSRIRKRLAQKAAQKS